MADSWDVLISYSRADQSFVETLAQRLTSDGFSVFYDQADIAVGSSLASALADAVRRARYVLIIMSPDYFESTWAETELVFALTDEIEQRRIKVIPVLYRVCDVPAPLRAKIFADFTSAESREKSYVGLVNALRDGAKRSIGVVDVGRQQRSRDSAAITPFGAARSVRDDASLRQVVAELREKVEAIMASNVDDSRPSESSDHESNLCFVVMPFAVEQLNDVYEFFIKPSLEARCGVLCVRGDDVFGSNVIMDDIKSSIKRCRLVVADLTGRNPNVFYEVGIAHTLNKDVLLLAQAMDDVPFDLRHRRVLLYDFSPRGCKKLEHSIVEHITAMLGSTA